MFFFVTGKSTINSRYLDYSYVRNGKLSIVNNKRKVSIGDLTLVPSVKTDYKLIKN